MGLKEMMISSQLKGRIYELDVGYTEVIRNRLRDTIYLKVEKLNLKKEMNKK